MLALNWRGPPGPLRVGTAWTFMQTDHFVPPSSTTRHNS